MNHIGVALGSNGFQLIDVDTRGRKTVAEAFGTEVEDELRRQEWIDRVFTHARSREDMMMINKERASTAGADPEPLMRGVLN